jgi:hypothetical protein
MNVKENLCLSELICDHYCFVKSDWAPRETILLKYLCTTLTFNIYLYYLLYSGITTVPVVEDS